MTGLATMQLVHVVPVRRLKGRRGPIRPDFDAQVAAQQCRRGIASDSSLARPGMLRPPNRPAVDSMVSVPISADQVARNLDFHLLPDLLPISSAPPCQPSRQT